MAVNDFSAVTSDFVQTALAWTHPCVSYTPWVHVHRNACAWLWDWCVQRCTSLEVAAILIRFEGSGDKVHWGVTEPLQTDSSSQHPASPCLPSTYSSSSCSFISLLLHKTPSARLSLIPSTFILSFSFSSPSLGLYFYLLPLTLSSTLLFIAVFQPLESTVT